MPASLREKVLLKGSIYHIVAYVNNECMRRGNYVVVRENLTYLDNHNLTTFADTMRISQDFSDVKSTHT